MRSLLVIFESPTWGNYGSLTAFRPTYCLRTGMTSLWQPTKRAFPEHDLGFICRESVAHVSLRETGIIPNKIPEKSYQRTVFLEASIRANSQLVEELQQVERSQFFSDGERIVAAVLIGADLDEAAKVEELLSPSDESSEQLASEFESGGYDVRTIEAKRYEYIWDLMLANPENIIRDFDIALLELGDAREHNLAKRLENCKIIGEGETYIHPTATVLPGSVIDTSSGPVYLDEETIVEPGSYIVGPFYAGANCKLLGGKLAGSSLGPFCQVAGELEESVLQGYVNKHHAGFIGHSYVGEWVNFGAMTTNSDLKNNYSSVRVSVRDELIDSGSNKIGSFIGDHSKFGIGTLLNTGISIGAFCNIFGGALITDKSVPSFSWGASGAWQLHDLEKALETAKRAMARRQRTLPEEDITLIRSLFENLER